MIQGGRWSQPAAGKKKAAAEASEPGYNPAHGPFPEAGCEGGLRPALRNKTLRDRLDISTEVAYVSFGLDAHRVGCTHRCSGHPPHLSQYTDDARGRSTIPGRHQVTDGTGPAGTHRQGEQAKSVRKSAGCSLGAHVPGNCRHVHLSGLE